MQISSNPYTTNTNSIFGPAPKLFDPTSQKTNNAAPAPVSDQVPVLSPDDLAEIAAEKKDLTDYQAQRTAEVNKRAANGMNPPAFMMALPVNGRGYMPFVNADQQKLIDSITDKYLKNPTDQTGEKMMAELTANGVNPSQLASSAKYFINLEGQIVSRQVATQGLNVKV